MNAANAGPHPKTALEILTIALPTYALLTLFCFAWRLGAKAPLPAIDEKLQCGGEEMAQWAPPP